MSNSYQVSGTTDSIDPILVTVLGFEVVVIEEEFQSVLSIVHSCRSLNALEADLLCSASFALERNDGYPNDCISTGS